VLSYVKIVDVDPSMMPASNAINIVPAPTPRLLMCDKSAVHANRVGLETPVANPNTIAANTNELYESTLDSKIIETSKMQTPISMVSRLPIRSESEEEKSLTNMVDMT